MRGITAMLLWFLLAGWTACTGSTPTEPPVPELWPVEQIEPPSGDFFEQRPWLLDLSTWAAEGCGEHQPDQPGQMGDFGIGNGHVFALMGYACPVNTLHTMVGPDYQQESEFFRDTFLEVYAAGEKLRVAEGHVFRVRHTAVLISRERSERLQWFTITFAPSGGDESDPLRRSVVRAVVVQNISDKEVTGIELVTDSGSTVRQGRQRTLVSLEPETGAGPDVVSLGSLAPGENSRAVMAYVMSIGGEGEAETIAALEAASLDDLLSDTIDDWQEFFSRATTLESPDLRVDDLLKGMLVTVRTQQTYLGGVSPMSRYTLMWIRDTAGPVRFLLKMGLFEEVRAMLDYYFTAAKVRGDISNAVSLDIDPEQEPDEPDWSSLPDFTGRAAGEIPSYLPLMGHWYTLATGDRSLVEEQYGLYLRCIFAQQLDEDGLLPFSGDETYRGAMGMAFGLAIEHDFVGCCKSANSSFLMGAAADALATEAEQMGHAEDAQNIREKGELARQGAEQAYWRTDSMYAPYLESADPDNLPPPFEDVSVKPLWTGYAGADDSRAIENLLNVMESLGQDDGFLQSPLDPMYDGYMELDVHEGVYTGMMPGYYLTNLTVAGHHEAENAFNALALAASPSGNFGEYQVYDDHSALQPIYDPGGTLGDLTARYRPWEGSICLDALVYYLTGFEPDSPNNKLSLTPRLPNGWPWMKWHKLRVGENLVDLEVTEQGGRRLVLVATDLDTPLEVKLSVPLGNVVVEKLFVDDERLSADEYELTEYLDGQHVELLPRTVDHSNPLAVELVYRAR